MNPVDLAYEIEAHAAKLRGSTDPDILGAQQVLYTLAGALQVGCMQELADLLEVWLKDKMGYTDN